MTEDEAFLRAILAAPADDTPRLVYADWLEETGRSTRAAFIRIQCALAASNGQPGLMDVHKSLLTEQAAIATRHLIRWDREFAAAAGLSRVADGRWDWGWERGFIEEFACNARDWLVVGRDVRATQPVRLVKLSDWQARLGELGRSENIAALDTLRLTILPGERAAAAILADAAGGSLGQVRRLELDMPVSTDLTERIRDRLPGVRIALRSEFK